VTLEVVPIHFVAKDGGPESAPAAFAELEAALPSLRGRRFYGYYEPTANRYAGIQPGRLPAEPGARVCASRESTAG